MLCVDCHGMSLLVQASSLSRDIDLIRHNGVERIRSLVLPVLSVDRVGLFTTTAKPVTL